MKINTSSGLEEEIIDKLKEIFALDRYIPFSNFGRWKVEKQLNEIGKYKYIVSFKNIYEINVIRVKALSKQYKYHTKRGYEILKNADMELFDYYMKNIRYIPSEFVDGLRKNKHYN